MITINNYSKYEVYRSLADLIEPFVVKLIRKENHTFFVYRCSDYPSLKILGELQKFNLENFELMDLFEKYWTSIDIILIKIENMPSYVPTKEYFEKLNDLLIKEKMVVDIIPYEVKFSSTRKKANLSINTYKLINELKSLGRELKIVKVFTDGNMHFKTVFADFKKEDYIIKTHYGREGRTITLKNP